MLIATWNILHRVHAVNWAEPAIATHVDEDARVAAIAAEVAALAADLVCMQEVSGDQLVALRALGRPVHAMRYPRVPRYFRSGEAADVPRDRGEYLVTLGDARELFAESFTSDRGKGFQVLEVGEYVVVNTHVTFGDKHAMQCARIAEAVRDHARVVIVGDFNADRETCEADLGGAFAAATPAGTLSTRPRSQPAAGKSEHIDHVLVRGCTIAEARVASGAGLSDHNPVLARIDP